MKRHALLGIFGAVGALLLSSCSTPSHQPSASPVPHWSKAQVGGWAKSAVELAGNCETKAKALDDALHSDAASSADVTLAAGDAFESCSVSLETASQVTLARTMTSQFPAGTALLQSWMDSVATISSMILEDSFGGSVSPPTDTSIVLAQQRSNAVADQFEGLIIKIANSQGVTFPEDQLLYRWTTSSP